MPLWTDKTPTTERAPGKMRETARRLRPAVLASAAAALTLALSGCAQVDTTSPSTARAAAAKGAPAKLGTVDCREANGAKPE